jgi:hypothetical protein
MGPVSCSLVSNEIHLEEGLPSGARAASMQAGFLRRMGLTPSPVLFARFIPDHTGLRGRIIIRPEYPHASFLLD